MIMATSQWISLILLIIFLICLIWFITYSSNKMEKALNESDKKDCVILFENSISISLFFGYFISILKLGALGLAFTPTAMDVYEDKTELQYTIKNGEIVDSIAVYK